MAKSKRKVIKISHRRLLHPALVELEKNPFTAPPIAIPFEAIPSLDLTARICVYIRIGGYPEIAAQACGLSLQTWQSWLTRGSRALTLPPPIPHDDILYADLVLKVRQAVAQSELRDVARIDAAGREDWKASWTKLKTRHPERWNLEKTSRVTIAGDPDAPVEMVHHRGFQTIDPEKLDLATCEAILSQLERRRAAPAEIPALPAPTSALGAETLESRLTALDPPVSSAHTASGQAAPENSPETISGAPPEQASMD